MMRSNRCTGTGDESILGRADSKVGMGSVRLRLRMQGLYG